MAEPTQMVIISVPLTCNLDDNASPAGQSWQGILEIIRRSLGYRRLYWGRQVEKSENVQLHIVRGTLQQHYDFLSSKEHSIITNLFSTLTSQKPTIRHALVSEFSPSCQSLGKGAPVTGTAIYRSTNGSWDMAWARWVSIVQNIPGFLGIAGGHVIEAVDGHERCFIALVGWENVGIHDAYHHTKHFRNIGRHVLIDPAEGKYNYYGHIAFKHNEDVGKDKGKL